MFRGRFFRALPSAKTNKSAEVLGQSLRLVHGFSYAGFSLKTQMCTSLAVQISPPRPSETKAHISPPTPPERLPVQDRHPYLTTDPLQNRIYTGLAFQSIPPTTPQAQLVPDSNAHSFTKVMCLKQLFQIPPPTLHKPNHSSRTPSQIKLV